eukprot:6662942-Prymnesium_polylepis.1
MRRACVVTRWYPPPSPRPFPSSSPPHLPLSSAPAYSSPPPASPPPCCPGARHPHDGARGAAPLGRRLHPHVHRGR